MGEWLTSSGRRDSCWRCYARSGLLRLTRCRRIDGEGPYAGRWVAHTTVTCLDGAACEARRVKRLERSRVRGSRLVLAEPRFPSAPRGVCRWCGAGLTGENGGARSYCRLDREGRDCLGESDRSRCWSAYTALSRRGDPCCVDCGATEGAWEADHEVALEDGGEHSLDNLVRRCAVCHGAKTAREATERARRRREARAGQATT